jgi:hypothetical protein
MILRALLRVTNPHKLARLASLSSLRHGMHDEVVDDPIGSVDYMYKDAL